MSKKVNNQKFGGAWSLLKLDTVSAYLKQFNVALQHRPSADRPFRRIYIDAFAGSGTFSFSKEAAPLLQEEESLSHHSGSARRALDVDPPFDEAIFIEQSAKNVGKLRHLAAAYPSSKVIQGDANIEVQKLCATTNWKDARGVIFLDPFGASVEWETLEAIGRTQALDVWYLFPLFGLYRNAPHDPAALDAIKQRTLTRLLGTDQWKEAFYRTRAPAQDLFGNASDTSSSRSVIVEEMEAFLKQRLEIIFPSVLKPRHLPDTGAPMFSLFFAVSNPSKKAQKIANGIAQHLLNKL